MPTYGYECDSCFHTFEVFQLIKESPLTTCPDCAGRVHRILYSVTVSFQGDG